MESAAPSINEMMDMTEAELETLAYSSAALRTAGNNDAKYVLGRLMVEGSSDKVPMNENKGLNWLREAIKQHHMGALEYKIYWDIRFDRSPKLDQIVQDLEKIIEVNKSPRACNTLAELNHASASGETAASTSEVKQNAKEKKIVAAKYYMISAEGGDQLGHHWIGVFYHEGFGVNVNMEKAIENLTIAAEAGNGQSMYQLYMIYSGKENQDQKLKNVQLAYEYLVKAINTGVTYFDEAISFFKDNYAALAPNYVKMKKLSIEVNKESEKDILNMHDAQLGEIKVTFSNALSKDRMYHRPCGFINDQQIWMMGVQVQFFLSKVLRFSHKDFLKALTQDLGPVLGDTGVWCLKCIQDNAKEQGDDDLKKRAKVAIELVEKFLENGIEMLGDEKKYHYINKFSPKKCPKEQINRDDIKNSYSWQHYAPLQWFDHKNKVAKEINNMKIGTPEPFGKRCNNCQAPEGNSYKHKQCSACRTTFYCSTDCQRNDWKGGHNKQCKEIQRAQNMMKK